MNSIVSPPFVLARPVSHATIAEVAGWLEPGSRGFMPPASDRAVWEAATLDRAAIVASAEREMSLPVPVLTDDLYLDFMESGRREPFTVPYDLRIWRAVRLALAESVEYRGRFLPALRELVTAILAEKSWVYPMHDGPVGYAAFHGRCTYIDLGAAVRAGNLGTIYTWLGDRLGADLREGIRAEIDRRIVQPYLRYVFEGQSAPGWWWVTATTNWNSVCHAGLVYAALATVEDRETRARIAASAAEYTALYFDGFNADGYISEGLGYWNYGFGHFIVLAETLLRATGGRLDLYQRHAARAAAVASYPLRARISASVYPAFSDCAFDAKPDFSLLRLLARHVELPAAEIAPGTGPAGQNAYKWDLDLAPPVAPAKRIPVASFSPLRGYFPEAGVLIVRPAPGAAGLSVAMKGGHNAEMHNHNDVGSFTVVIDDVPVIADPGTEVYTKRTFTEQRYESPVLNSYGHSVPMIGGELQPVGRPAEAMVLAAEFTDASDRFVLDLTAAYAAAGLQNARRTFLYERAGAGSLTVVDEFVLARPLEIGTALVTLGEWRQEGPGQVRAVYQGAALRVEIGAGGAEFSLRDEALEAELPDGRRARRLGIDLTEPTGQARIEMRITPDNGSRLDARSEGGL